MIRTQLYLVGKAGFIWCHGTWLSTSTLLRVIPVGKAGFIWCHGTDKVTQLYITINGWKSRFYLMSRNRDRRGFKFSMYVLEKPVLFDVTERKDPTNELTSGLEKPVLFDVTELIRRCVQVFHLTSWKSRFYLMSRNTYEKGTIHEQRLRWKSRFYLMSRNLSKVRKERSDTCVGKAGFIWCHGTSSPFYYLSPPKLEKPVLFDVTELRIPFPFVEISDVGKAGFIWCHGTQLRV